MARVTELTAAELLELPCPYCGRQLPRGTEWLDQAQDRWGHCGVKLTRNGTVEAVLAMAPGRSTGEAIVKMIWVRPEVSRVGLGRQLVQSAAGEAERAKLSTLVAVGAGGNPTCATPPRGFLTECGFTRPAGESLWRLDLNQSVLERSGLGLVSRLLRGLGRSGPEPAGGAVSGRSTRS